MSIPPRRYSLGQVIVETDLDRNQTGEVTIIVNGTLVSRYREAGKLAFWMLHDGASELQIILTPQRLGHDKFEAADDTIRGLRVSAQGVVTRTPRGILSILAEDVWFE